MGEIECEMNANLNRTQKTTVGTFEFSWRKGTVVESGSFGSSWTVRVESTVETLPKFPGRPS